MICCPASHPPTSTPQNLIYHTRILARSLPIAGVAYISTPNPSPVPGTLQLHFSQRLIPFPDAQPCSYCRQLLVPRIRIAPYSSPTRRVNLSILESNHRLLPYSRFRFSEESRPFPLLSSVCPSTPPFIAQRVVSQTTQSVHHTGYSDDPRYSSPSLSLPTSIPVCLDSTIYQRLQAKPLMVGSSW
ncbi:predicted protein [Plenodomus lingam JN3]|uniref:Predicted protein n=1 Tax=Leptosphaeria maculans (strain JN3 / isolate v23.1.3 / race Av1-4-5-6-7-8) TaxID=985895 RepID=E4ZTV0_LEPMJ|nr:predicted protein [Plenodomus lingam JN3]CBX94660.1 predicted protein [Plenodomus lingam JN3]